MSTPHYQRMPNPSPADTSEGQSHTHRAMAEGTTFTLPLGNRPPSYQATVEDEPSITAEDDQPGRHTTTGASTHPPDHLHSDSTATYVASDNGDHLTTTSTPSTPTSTSNATTPAPTEPYYPSSPPPMPDNFPDFDTDPDPGPAAQARLDAFLQARMHAVRVLRGPLPTEYEHLDFHSPGYNPAPRFQFRMQPPLDSAGSDGGGGGGGGGGGLLPLSEIRRDLYILNAIYPEHRNLFVLMLRLYENCDPGDEMVLRSVNALPHMRYLVGLCRTCFMVVGGGEWCCGEVVPE